MQKRKYCCTVFIRFKLALCYLAAGDLDAYYALRSANLAVRVQDILFALRTLHELNQGKGEAAELPGADLFIDRLDLSRVGVLGHSFGGATSMMIAHLLNSNPSVTDTSEAFVVTGNSSSTDINEAAIVNDNPSTTDISEASSVEPELAAPLELPPRPEQLQPTASHFPEPGATSATAAAAAQLTAACQSVVHGAFKASQAAAAELVRCGVRVLGCATLDGWAFPLSAGLKQEGLLCPLLCVQAEKYFEKPYSVNNNEDLEIIVSKTNGQIGLGATGSTLPSSSAASNDSGTCSRHVLLDLHQQPGHNADEWPEDPANKCDGRLREQYLQSLPLSNVGARFTTPLTVHVPLDARHSELRQQLGANLWHSGARKALMVKVESATHTDFTDVGFWAPLLTGHLKVTRLPPTHIHAIMAASVSGFFQHHMGTC